MTQTQTQSAAREEATLAFKRYILEQSGAYASEPTADLYRVNLLGRMLNRYDELLGEGVGEGASILRVKAEFADIPEQMREQGFELAREGEQKGKRDTRSTLESWPRLSEDDAARYIKESSDRNHKTAIGTALCSACVLPLMITAGLGEMFGGAGEDFIMMFGLVGMFAMIGIGCYLFSLAKKPKDRDKIKKGRFSLSAGLRAKLRELREMTQEKARRRRAMGIAMLATCVVPIFIGAAFGELWMGDALPIFGVAGMFAMIGAGVYQVMMGESEKKVMKDLLREKE